MRLDRVADIGDLRFRADTPDDAFHSASKAIFEAEIGGEGEDGHGIEDFRF